MPSTGDALPPLAPSTTTTTAMPPLPPPPPETVMADDRRRSPTAEVAVVVGCRRPCRTLIWRRRVSIGASCPRGNTDLPSRTYPPRRPANVSTLEPTTLQTCCATVGLSRRCPTHTCDVISAGNCTACCRQHARGATPVSNLLGRGGDFEAFRPQWQHVAPTGVTLEWMNRSTVPRVHS